MKVSQQWLRQWLPLTLDAQAMADQLTMAGLEVDSIEQVAGAFSGVVVAQVVSIQPHPDANRLSVCQVDIGAAENLQVVCGAPNVAVNQKVAFARTGAVLPGDFRISRTTLRGVESNGMICAESELGLVDEKSPGIWVLPSDAPVGEDLRSWLQLDDAMVDIDLTPNRGDCLSVAGLARELGVLNRQAVSFPEISDVPAETSTAFDVSVSASRACPRYAARVIEHIDVTAETPLWMKERLRRSGVRSIDPVVDVTNYVMLELGQPMHAFDLDQLDQHIDVRMAQAGEELTLLDGQTIELHEETLLITDASGPIAIAGIMGGERSGVGRQTRHVVLESAFFAPLSVAGRARSYGLHTDASHRFERGVDPALQLLALERATRLLMDICGGQPGPVVEIASPDYLPTTQQVTLDSARVTRLLGSPLGNDEIVDILTRLGMSLNELMNGHWQVEVPSWRFDISQDVDLIEELARVHGYNRFSSRAPQARMVPKRLHEERLPLDRLRHHLVAAGYQEAITYSFISREQQALLTPDTQAPELANPISSDMAVMRSSLWPGLLRAIQHNLNRQQTRVRLFEIGQVFQGDIESLKQYSTLAGAICGSRESEGWLSGRESVDFYDLKGDVEALISLGGQPSAWRFEATEHPVLHPGQSAQIFYRERPVGWLGALHPRICEELDIRMGVFVFEVELEAIRQAALPMFSPLSRYPEVRRDLAMIVSEHLPVAELLALVREYGGEHLRELRLFDVYQGAGVETGYKSIALGLTWQHASRTLTDEEINHLVDAIVNEASNRFGATLRGQGESA
ncbi:phenylalanine--tRNA ligase subunit beta [Kushneria phosphatilytica]|uniref:Phenylalanine--tRNA ligase beta subunit n=1 Tax=Kushneria phosphatilytica TaxID=657387 RepID=A0A1S1P0H7_9GAMM|nr:phenylalanine--tRNA ligase subunit beta [Kushneria phosphatilytica]OHV11985.1 phenylalanine--tRNA ligase subunit beta [Kushneria phosphatilytica]QEL11171.1 phenylalanine--tRNA ligase subunit beta [Kushneria phosphatilytica]